MWASFEWRPESCLFFAPQAPSIMPGTEQAPGTCFLNEKKNTGTSEQMDMNVDTFEN